MTSRSNVSANENVEYVVPPPSEKTEAPTSMFDKKTEWKLQNQKSTLQQEDTFTQKSGSIFPTIEKSKQLKNP